MLSGAVEILDPSSEEPRTLGVHQPGEFTGDIDILSRRRSVVSAVARGDTQVLHIPSAEIRHIIAQQPTLGELLLKAFIARRELLMASGFQGLQVIGSERSRDTFRITRSSRDSLYSSASTAADHLLYAELVAQEKPTTARLGREAMTSCVV